MTSLESFYTNLVNRIYEEDFDNQMIYLEAFASGVRGMPIEPLIKYQSFFVPDDDYLHDISGGVAVLDKYGLYRGDECRFKRRLVTPIRDFKDNIVAFVGYDDGSDLPLAEKEGLVKYLYSDKTVFEKGKHMFITSKEYRKSLEESYIMLVDGIYDKEMLSHAGYNAASLLGTQFTTEHQYYLKPIKNWIIPYDMDSAGVALYNYAKSINPNTVALKFMGTKDIDARLKLPGGFETLHQVMAQMKSEKYTLSGSMDLDIYNNMRRIG